MRKFNILKWLKQLVISNIPSGFFYNQSKVECILITRFNRGNNPIAITEEYLDKRFEIFDKYTFPSINNQTDRDFKWIILFNDKTPDKYKNLVKKYQEKSNMKFIPLFNNYESDIPTITDLISPHLNSNIDYLLTCRCDNDDMLAKNYIEKMKKNFTPIDNMFIDFIYGYCFDNKTEILKNYKSRSNHFIGYVDKIKYDKNIKTVCCCNHAMAENYGLIKRINNKKYPLWCEIIHDTNQINQSQGDIVDNKVLTYFNQNFKYLK